jgi:hypothetical protein
MAKKAGDSDELLNLLKVLDLKESLTMSGIRVWNKRRNSVLIWTLLEKRRESEQILKETEQVLIIETNGRNLI